MDNKAIKKLQSAKSKLDDAMAELDDAISEVDSGALQRKISRISEQLYGEKDRISDVIKEVRGG